MKIISTFVLFALGFAPPALAGPVQENVMKRASRLNQEYARKLEGKADYKVTANDKQLCFSQAESEVCWEPAFAGRRLAFRFTQPEYEALFVPTNPHNKRQVLKEVAAFLKNTPSRGPASVKTDDLQRIVTDSYLVHFSSGR